MLKVKLRAKNTVSQIYDGASNFSGHIKGCDTLFEKSVPHAQYFHCSNHDSHLALCHTCCNKQEIKNTLGTITGIGLFFKYSPKRAQLVESIIVKDNTKTDVRRGLI